MNKMSQNIKIVLTRTNQTKLQKYQAKHSPNTKTLLAIVSQLLTLSNTIKHIKQDPDQKYIYVAYADGNNSYIARWKCANVTYNQNLQFDTNILI